MSSNFSDGLGQRIVAAIVVAGVACAGMVAFTPAAQAADPPDPALLYSFDESPDATNVRNTGSAGSVLDGRVKNAATLQRGTGATSQTGASGVFPGAAQGSATMPAYVEIPNGLFDGTDSLTVATWIKWDGKYANELPWAYIVGSDALPANNWGVYYQPTEGGQSKAVANSGTEVKAAGPALKPNEWVYLTTAVTPTSLSYYLNGALVRSESIAFDVSRLSSAGSTFSGLLGKVQWAGEWAAHFPGQFDEFAVYREALDAAEVSALFTSYTGSIASVKQTTFDVTTSQRIGPELPATVGVTYSGGSSVDLPIAWEPVPPTAFAQAGTFQVKGTVPGWDGKLTANVTVQARATEKVSVDFSQDTGAFRGGASGTLYGLGDEQSPTQALVNGAAMTNISQKPPFGTQHPGGDVFNVEDTFFDKWGKELYVYAQDYYPDWPYHFDTRPGDELTFTRNAQGDLTGEKTDAPNGVWDYLEILETVAASVAKNADDPTKYVFIPFNEPEWIWYDRQGTLYRNYLIYGGQPDSYTPGGVSDWEAAWDVITAAYAKEGLDRPKIAGPGDSIYMGEADMREFLTAAKKNGTVPDVYVWHELGGYAWIPDRMVGYRNAVRDAGIAEKDTPQVNITEYGASNDMSSPASLLRWFSSFEAAKVDAQTAYWTASGTMSDNQAKVNSANGGWWLFNWYGDLNGSRTVKVTAGEQRAIAAVDAANKRAQVIFGGVERGKDAVVELTKLDTAVFGDKVDIEVRETRVSGTDGEQGTPRVVASADGVNTSGASIEVPASDEYSAFQVIVTPNTARDVAAERTAQALQYGIEAENTALTSATVRLSPGNGYRASDGRDVVRFDTAQSRAEWTVDVAEAGLYRFEVIGATPGVPVQHALFVDDANPQTVQYGANAMKPGQVQSVARGSAEVFVQLNAGTHTLSLRTSTDGSTLLPNAGYARDGVSGVSLDRFSLTRVGDEINTETRNYPAATFRLAEGATLGWSGATAGSANLSNGGRADLYPATLESGYYDVTANWSGAAGATLKAIINGREATQFTSAGAEQDSRVRVHLPEGITEIELIGAGEVTVSTVTTTRAVTADAAIARIEAEDLSRVQLAGTASTRTFGTGPTDGIATTGTGGYVGGLGITDRNPANEGTLTIGRGAGFDQAGEYDAIVHFSNDSIEGTHSYNPQVVDLGLQAKESGSEALVGRSTFRYTYLASNFWEGIIPLTLTSADKSIEFGNTRETLYVDEGPTGSASDDVAVPGYAIAPNVDWIAFAPFVLETDGSSPVTVTPTATAEGGVSASGWYRSPVSMTFTSSAQDTRPEYRIGVDGQWQPATGPALIATDGVTTVFYRATRDDVAVPGSEGQVEVKLDRSLPVTTATTNPPSGTVSSGATVTATFTATDTGSGVARTEYSVDAGATWVTATPAGVSFTAVGSHPVQYRSVDRAGNAEVTRQVLLTVTEPRGGAKVTITSNDKPTAEGWYQQSVMVKLTAPTTATKVQYRLNDGAWRSYTTSITVSANGTTKIDHRLVSSNLVVPSSDAQTIVKIDKQLPTVTATRTPAAGTGTPRNPIQVDFAANDALSGVHSVQYRINSADWATVTDQGVSLGEVGDYVISYRASDKAGNTSVVKSLTVTISENVSTVIKSSVKTVKPGGAVTLTLVGFARWDDVTIALGAASVVTVLTDQNGAAKVTVKIPADTAKGALPIAAIGSDSVYAYTEITVKR